MIEVSCKVPVLEVDGKEPEAGKAFPPIEVRSVEFGGGRDCVVLVVPGAGRIKVNVKDICLAITNAHNYR